MRVLKKDLSHITPQNEYRCDYCGEIYYTSYTSLGNKYCSNAHKQQAYLARKIPIEEKAKEESTININPINPIKMETTNNNTSVKEMIADKLNLQKVETKLEKLEEKHDSVKSELADTKATLKDTVLENNKLKSTLESTQKLLAEAQAKGVIEMQDVTDNKKLQADLTAQIAELQKKIGEIPTSTTPPEPIIASDKIRKDLLNEQLLKAFQSAPDKGFISREQVSAITGVPQAEIKDEAEFSDFKIKKVFLNSNYFTIAEDSKIQLDTKLPLTPTEKTKTDGAKKEK